MKNYHIKTIVFLLFIGFVFSCGSDDEAQSRKGGVLEYDQRSFEITNGFQSNGSLFSTVNNFELILATEGVQPSASGASAGIGVVLQLSLITESDTFIDNGTYTLSDNLLQVEPFDVVGGEFFISRDYENSGGLLTRIFEGTVVISGNNSLKQISLNLIDSNDAILKGDFNIELEDI